MNMMHGDRKMMNLAPSLLGRTFRAVTLSSTMLVSFAVLQYIQTAAAASLKSGRYEASNGAVIEVQGKSFYYTGKWNGEPVRRKPFVLELRPDATFMMARTVCSIGDQSISCTSPSGNETSYIIVTANRLPIQEKAATATVNEPAAQPVNAEAAAKIAALEILLNKNTTDLTAMKEALKKSTQENQDLRLAVDKDAGTRTKV